MTLKGVRIQYNLSQIEAANIIGIPVRSLRRYELDDNYGSTLKRQMFIELLNKHCEISEEKGLLTIELIKQLLTDLFDTDYKGEIEFCFLFGSYAKGTATETSDVDLYVSSSLSGLRFVGLIERARQVLHKKVDLIRSSELKNNANLINEVLKDGIRIYKQ